MATDEQRIEEILGFWFDDPPEGEERATGRELWFARSSRVDREIQKRFGRLVEKAKSGALDAWAVSPRGRLALIILLDQFNRNLHRDTPEAFTGDEKALALCLDGLDEAMDKKLRPLERCFFYMPAMHAEDTDAQLASVEVFEELVNEVAEPERSTCAAFLKHARLHRDVVERFERFPHRNSILGRTSSSEEAAFLQQMDQL